MRKMLTLIIATMLCAAPVAHADNIEVHDPVVLPVSYEDIGGDAYWPNFRDLHWSMDKDVVLLIEQSRGVEFTPLREGEDLSVYVAEDVDVLGHNAGLRYFFTDSTGLYRISASILLSGDDAADAETIGELLTALMDEYGAPEADKWQDGGWEWPDDADSHMLAIWGHDAVGERHAAGDKYLIGQVGLEARVISDGTRMVSVIMLGQMKMTPAR